MHHCESGVLGIPARAPELVHHLQHICISRDRRQCSPGPESRWRSAPRRATEHETPSTQSAAVPGTRSARGRSRISPHKRLRLPPVIWSRRGSTPSHTPTAVGYTAPLAQWPGQRRADNSCSAIPDLRPRLASEASRGPAMRGFLRRWLFGQYIDHMSPFG